MRLKKGVSVFGLRNEILLAISIVESVYLDEIQQGVTITSVTEGTHSYNSFHYSGNAFDIRTRFDYRSDQWSNSIKKRLVAEIKSRLNDEFDVVLHSTHIHIEFQPKR